LRLFSIGHGLDPLREPGEQFGRQGPGRGRRIARRAQLRLQLREHFAVVPKPPLILCPLPADFRQARGQHLGVRQQVLAKPPGKRGILDGIRSFESGIVLEPGPGIGSQ